MASQRSLMCKRPVLVVARTSLVPCGRAGVRVATGVTRPPARRRGRGRRRRRGPRRRRGSTCGRRGRRRADGMTRSRMVAGDGLAQRAVEQLGGPAEHELVQVERADHRGQRRPEPLAGAAETWLGVLRRRVAARRRGTASTSRGSRPGRRRTASPSGRRLDVADLAGGARGGRAAADRRGSARRRHRCRPGPASGRLGGAAEGVLAERGDVGVVGDVDGQAESLARGSPPRWTSCQPRLGASSTVPSASTTPGVPTPMPSTGRVGHRDQVCGELGAPGRRRPRPAAPPRRAGSACSDRAGEVDHRADDPVVDGQVDRRRCG